MASRLRNSHKHARLVELAPGPQQQRRPLFFTQPAQPTARRSLGTRQIQIRLLTTPTARKPEDISAKQAAAFGSLHLTWPHKGWDDSLVHEVVASHRKPRTFGDKVAWRAIRICRYAPVWFLPLLLDRRN